MTIRALTKRFVLLAAYCLSSQLPAVASANSLWSSDCEMMFDPMSTYDVGETICVTGDVDTVAGGFFFPSADVYIVKNRQWSLGDHLVDHFGNTTLIESQMNGGAFISEVVQSPPLEAGEYDLLLDEDRDGYYSNGDIVLGVGTDYALVVVADALFADSFEYGVAPWSTIRGSNYGIGIDGLPEWFERAAAVVNNAVRMAPQEYRDTYMPYQLVSHGEFLLPENYTAVEPLVYLRGLNLAARFHAEDLSVNCNRLQHDSCDGTSWGLRCNSFVNPFCNCSGEVLFFNYEEPRRQVNIWLCETSTSQCYADGSGWDGHRSLMMSNVHGSLGVGIARDYVVQDYSFCRGEFRPPLVDGSHIFFEGNLLFLASYFDSLGYGPQEVVLIIDGVEHAMSLDIGQAQAGTYAVSLSPTGQCRSYFFRATTSAGLTYRYPEVGQLQTYGEACAEAWVP